MGAALVRRYARSRKVIAFKRTDLDVLDLARIKPALAAHQFDCLIYTAGITSVDQCEVQPREAELTNTEAPRVLAEVCKESGARFIHVSTDYVFSGEEPGLRKEADVAEPINVYGRTKLEGERAVLAVSPDFLVTRVSWLFGPDKAAFPDRILHDALQNDRVEAIADKWSCPTYSEDLAEWMEPMLFDARYSGVLHLSNSGFSTWLEYGQTVLDLAAKLGLPIKTRTVLPVSRHDFPAFKARRPAHTEFDTTRFEELSGTTPRPWQEALEEYLRLKYT